MKKFRFRLSTLERVRKNRELDASRVLAESQQALLAEKARNAMLLASLERALARREILGAEPVPPVLFQMENDFITGTKQRLKQSEHAIMRANRGVEKALRAYLHARRQTRMIEIMRERAQAEYRREATKQENKKLDELYVTRFRLSKEELI